MEVDARGGDVGGDEHPDGLRLVAEVGDQLLLLHVAHSPVHGVDLLRSEDKVLSEVLGDPAHGLDSLGEDDEAVACVGGVPRIGWVTEQPEEALVAREAVWADGSEGGSEGLELSQVVDAVRIVSLGEASDSVVDSLEACSRA